MLPGSVWLAARGALALLSGELRGGLRYDAWLHTLLLGFVFALIFGHAPIIRRAVTGLPLAYRHAFYYTWRCSMFRCWYAWPVMWRSR